jgi:hypothetical protein
MTQASFGDAARDKLRVLVESFDREISLRRSTTADPSADPLHAMWRELVEQLALGPAPETRKCPDCGGTGMRDASRCSHCWIKLQPLAASTIAPPIAPVHDASIAATAQEG